jgi:hypothetical protein
MIVALALRLYAVLRGDFPVNDGGLFYTMIRELQANGYRLPAFTGYNAEQLPFAYPPLGFYLIALLSDLTGVSTLELLRFVPAIVSWLTVPAFWLLSRALLGSRLDAAIATLAFTLLPRTWLWFVMGGGLTRSLGFLFVLLMLREVYLMYTARGGRHVITAAVLGALAVTSHLENAWFGVYSAVLLFLAFGRHRAGVRDSALVALGVACLSAPWWLTVIRVHGLAPFLYANRAAGPHVPILPWLLRFTFTDEPFLPVLSVLGLLGLLASVGERRLFLPLWLVTIFLINPRNPTTPAAVPLAMLVATGVRHVLVPGAMAVAARVQERHRMAAMACLLAPLLVYTLMAARSVAGNNQLLGALTRGDRDAIRWAAQHTPPSSRFLIVTGKWFGGDASAEWFPALSGRTSVGTVQGSEWLPGSQFDIRWTESDSLRGCAGRSAACLESWARATGRPFSHVYVYGNQTRLLTESLRDSPAFQLVYDRDSVAVFARRESAGAR